MSHMPGTSQVPGMSRGRLCGCLRSQRGPDPGGVITMHLLKVPQLALHDELRHPCIGAAIRRPLEPAVR